MTDTVLKVKPCPVSDDGVQAINAMLVSCVENATDTATEHYDPKVIIEQIRTDEQLRKRVTLIREKFWSVMAETNNDRKAAKQAIDRDKKRLPGAIWSATFSRRKQNALLQHSGLLCADLDGLGDQITEIREKLVKSIFLWALFTSPTGDGLKAVFRVHADPAKHKASFRAVEKHVRESTGFQIDEACSDVSRLCFLSHDPDVYLNEDVVELPLPTETESREIAPPPPVAGDKLEDRRKIAEELLGDIDWDTDGSGFPTCPGEHLHTTGDTESQCIVYLSSVPTISCFHNHCRGIIAGINHELRSRIGKAEFAANANGAPKPSEWFNEKFPTLSEQFGEAVLVREDKDGDEYVSDIAEDFLAATLGDESSPENPTVFVPTEQKFYTYSPSDGIFNHQRDPALVTRLSRLLLDCARQSNRLVDTRNLKFRLRGSTKLTGVLKKAQGLLCTPDNFFSTGLTEFIPCANGMLRLSDKVLLPFSPAYRRRNKLAVPFDPNTQCPLFLDTLMRPALDPEELELLQRWCGLALVGENIAQRIVILSGTPGGGKGTFIRVLNGVIGPANVSSLRTQHLAERFELGRFLGKTLLYGADVPENFLNHRGASVLKSLTGYDPVTLEFKNSNESPIIICQFNVIVTCNSRLTVHLEGDTEAWRRRLAIVDYHNAKPKQVIADLDRQILATEASGVLNWMIEGLDKVRADCWQLTLSSGQERAVDNLLLESDSHNLFVREALVRADGQQLTVQDCFAAYVRFCSERGWITITRNKFTQTISDVVARTYAVTVRHDIKDGSGKAQRGWRGLQLKDKSCQLFEEEPFDDFE